MRAISLERAYQIQLSSLTMRENHVGSAVIEILDQTDRHDVAFIQGYLKSLFGLEN